EGIDSGHCYHCGNPISGQGAVLWAKRVNGWRYDRHFLDAQVWLGKRWHREYSSIICLNKWPQKLPHGGPRCREINMAPPDPCAAATNEAAQGRRLRVMDDDKVKGAL